MIIIGEKLNSSIPSTLEAFEDTTNKALLEIIENNVSAGSNYLDINTAMLEDRESDKMIETVELVLNNSDLGIMIDSVDMGIVARSLTIIGSRKCIINSISLSTDVTPLQGINLSNIGVVAMPTDDDGIPSTPTERLHKISLLVDKLLKLGFRSENIYADILIETIAVNQQSALNALNTLKLVQELLPEIKTICGASNIAFGLPNRMDINSAFIIMLVSQGISSMIIDPAHSKIKSALVICNLLQGKDTYCMDYINYIRSL